MINSTNKTQRNEGSVYDGINSGTNIKYGVVRVLENETGPEQNKGLGRIKVYICFDKSSFSQTSLSKSRSLKRYLTDWV